MSDAPSLRVVTRWYKGDRLPHLYLAVEVEDEKVNFLRPQGHESPLDFHPRWLLSATRIPSPVALTDACPRCARWAQRTPHTVLVQGEVRV
ncbi:hypothetical protein [Amycolatopsis sp. CA-230715]|uniref:hypothetical protein n=1 Tax=Amycolatopsis sp. CA-230715 TaxID=2745196 RepID=UPI001C02F7B7|nr:hypothetical protein [Amycolatopsis sp. CA-230715]QWF81120.1 hypothetical protein HUW46_04546 [Amycolatopsis sp. CA-230715]